MVLAFTEVKFTNIVLKLYRIKYTVFITHGDVS